MIRFQCPSCKIRPNSSGNHSMCLLCHRLPRRQEIRHERSGGLLAPTMKRLILGLFLALLAFTYVVPAQAGLLGLSSSIPGTLYTVDSTTGAATPITNLTGGTSGGQLGLAFLDGSVYVTDVFSAGAIHFGTINPVTGAFNGINNEGGGSGWQSLAAIPSTHVLYTVDRTDFGDNWMLLSVTRAGIIQQVGPTGVDITGLAYDSNNHTMYGVGYNHVDAILRLYSINTTNGQAGVIGSVGNYGGTSFTGLTFDPAADVLYMNLGSNTGGPNNLYQVNVVNGLATLIGPNGPTAGNGIDGLTILTPRPNPQPSPCLLSA